MKKYLALVLGTLFVLGFAAPSFAIHASIPAETAPVVSPLGIHTQIGGEIRVRGWYSDNITAADGTMARTGRPYDSPQMGWYDQRVRLFINSRIGANVSGRILLETAPDNYIWGHTNTLVTGGGTFAGGGSGLTGGGVSLRVWEAWIAYTGTGLLGVPSGIRLGHMPLHIGEGTYFDHRRRGDSAILLWVEPARGTDINFVAAKLFDGATVRVQDDIDLYSLALTHRLDKDNTIGANLSWVRSKDMHTAAPLPALYRMPTAGLSYLDARLNLWNAGLLARGRVADIGYRATVDFQFGNVSRIVPTPPATITSVDFRGWGATVGANYTIDPVTLRASFVYGSGDADATDKKNRAFLTFVSEGIDPNLPTVVYNNRVDTAAGIGTRGTGIANTTAFNIGITTDPIRDLRVHLDYYLLRASKRLDTRENHFGHSKDIGHELNLRATYRIARNLTYAINAGVLFAGDFYRDTRVVAGVPPVPERAFAVPKNAVVFQHQIVFAF